MSGRNVALDGLRGVAILLVLSHHFTQDIPSATVLDRLLFGFTNSTWIGVDLFFVLSGFLITGILYDAKRAGNYFQAFYARRILRIFPAYYLLLVVLFLVVPWLGHRLGGIAGREPVWFWLYGSNLLTALHGWPDRPVAHLWSLAIEEHFYLVWPLLIYWLRGRALLVVLLALLVAAIGLRWALLGRGFDASAIYVLTPTRVDTLALGGLVAFAMRHPTGRSWLGRWHLAIGWGAAVAVCLLAYRANGLDWLTWTRFQHSVAYTLIAIACAGAMARLIDPGRPAGPWARALSQPFMVWLGKISYAVYLFHLPLESVARQYGLHPSNHEPLFGAYWPLALIYFAGNTAVAVAAAWLSWHLIEQPLLRLKGRWRYRQQALPSAPADGRRW